MQNQSHAVYHKHVSASEIKKNQKKKASFDFQAVKPVSLDAVIKNQLSSTNLPTIGKVAIPSVNIGLPILKGLANENLLVGAGTLAEDQVMGERNYALASHRMFDESLLFTPLDHLKIGEKIYITDLTTIFIYQSFNNLKVDPHRIDLLNDPLPDQKPMITLITCGEMAGETRRIVQGELVETLPFETAPDEIKQVFTMSITPHL